MSQISIVIPAYNAEEVLTETLLSVQNQTFTDWELVIIDDGSQDGTFNLASSFAQSDSRIRVVHQTNTGVAGARNKGIAEISSGSKAVIFFDHDDLWRPDALQVLWDALANNPDSVGAHALGLLVETSAKGRTFTTHQGTTVDWKRRKMVRAFGTTQTIFCSRTEPTTFNVQVYDGCVCTPGLMLVRREALDRLGLFDPSVVPCDDWDMWVRLSLLGDVVFVDDILLNWCVYGGNSSLNKEKMGQGVSDIRRKMFTLPGLTPEQQLLAHTRYRRMYASVKRHNAQDAFSWSRLLFSKQKSAAALCYLKMAISLYFRYVALSLAWGPELDRGPIPRRLKDIAFPAELMPETAVSAGEDKDAYLSSHSLL